MSEGKKNMRRWVAVLLILLLAVVPVGMAQDDAGCAQISEGDPLELRRGPGEDFAATVTVTAGARVEADYAGTYEDEGGSWVYVSASVGEGWAPSKRLAECAEAGGFINNDGVLDRDEIAAIAPSVVYIERYIDGRIDGGGSGTVISADGFIYTNRHVVENADELAIWTLGDIDDLPLLSYHARVEIMLDELDFAILRIDRDAQKRPVAPESLDLVPLPFSREYEVARGDPLYIFGYPVLGDGYIVVTEGTVTTVQRGIEAGERMALWYQTDAEISPGNSGGLVVDGNGQFLGIPTKVGEEERTGGRLGIILPLERILALTRTGEPRGNPPPPPV